MTFLVDEWVLICTFRYSLGRMTYVVADCVELLLFYWPKLSSTTKDLIIKEIKYAQERNDLGMRMDAEQWEKILNQYENDKLKDK